MKSKIVTLGMHTGTLHALDIPDHNKRGSGEAFTAFGFATTIWLYSGFRSQYAFPT